MTGPIEGKHCVNVDEPGDPDTWVDNYFCSDQDIGLQWSSAGPVDGMDCVNVTEGSEENAAAWEDNYLCVPKGSPYTFSWSFAGPISGQTCVRWFEHSEKLTNTWQDNWMCFVSESAPSGSGGSSSGGEGGFGSGSGSSDGAGGDASGSASPKQRTDVLAEESGCACRAPSSTPRTPAWLALTLAALALLRRRTDS